MNLEKTKVIIKEDIIYKELDGEMVLLNMNSGEYYGVEEIGTYIWQYIEEKMELQNIVKALLEEFDVSEQQCNEHVTEFLVNLQKAGLIDLVSQ